MKRKPRILWDVLTTTNDGLKLLPDQDPCRHIGYHMSKLLNCEYTSNEIYGGPIHYAKMRYNFNYKYWEEKLKDVDILITDQSTHIRNFKVIKPGLKVVMLTPFIDIKYEPKVDEPYRYYLRQIDSMLAADLIAAQSQYNADEYIDHVMNVVGIDITNKVTIWPWGYSQSEINKYSTADKYGMIVIYFPNRITETTHNYHHREFAEAIGLLDDKVADRAHFVFRNPTRKATEPQVQLIMDLSGGRAHIMPNSSNQNREEYMGFINGASASVHLCTLTHRGMSHDESAAMGNITISPDIASTHEFWMGYPDYPFLLRDVKDGNINPVELSRTLKLLIDILQHNKSAVSEMSKINKALIKNHSYEEVAIKVKYDIDKL